MQKIFKLKAQIKALNTRLENGNIKNIYAIKNKIKALKEQLTIEQDNYNWETYLSN